MAFELLRPINGSSVRKVMSRPLPSARPVVQAGHRGRSAARAIGVVISSCLLSLCCVSPARGDEPTPTPVPPLAMLHMNYAVTTRVVLPSLAGIGQTTKGAFEADVSLRNGSFAGALTIPDLAGQAMLYGFVPSPFVASIAPADLLQGAIVLQPGVSVGAMDATYAATLSVRILALGVLPINGGEKCKSSSAIAMHVITAKGAPFDVFRGGRVTASFAIPKFSGCGRFDSVFNAVLVTDSVNQLQLDLTPKS